MKSYEFETHLQKYTGACTKQTAACYAYLVFILSDFLHVEFWCVKLSSVLPGWKYKGKKRPTHLYPIFLWALATLGRFAWAIAINHKKTKLIWLIETDWHVTSIVADETLTLRSVQKYIEIDGCQLHHVLSR